MNKVLKTVLHLSLLIIGPTVALMLAHQWPTGGPPVAQLAATCHCWANVGPLAANGGGATGGPTLGPWWPTGQNDVGPPVAANGGPTAEPPVAQRRSHRWPNVGPPGSCYLGYYARRFRPPFSRLARSHRVHFRAWLDPIRSIFELRSIP